MMCDYLADVYLILFGVSILYLVVVGCLVDRIDL